MDQAKEDVFKASSISAIALNTLGITTLDTQNSDRLDFHDLAVGNIRAALNAAYEAGKSAGKKIGHQQ